MISFFLDNKFLQSYTKTGEPFETEAKFQVNLPQTGTYNISFFTIMYCNSNDCEAAQDFMRIVIVAESVLVKGKVSEETLAEIKLDTYEQNKWSMTTKFYEMKKGNSPDVEVSI